MREPVAIGVAVLAVVNFVLLVLGIPELSEELEVALAALINAGVALLVRSRVTPVR